MSSLSLRFLLVWTLLVVFSVGVWSESRRVVASDKSVSLVVSEQFQGVSSPPADTLIALESQGGEVSLFVTTGEKVDFDSNEFAEHMQMRFEAGGAEVLGKATANLGNRPAVSFLIGSVKPGKESLMVFNLRDEKVYLFILNYPVGSRTGASKLWQALAPTITFHSS